MYIKIIQKKIALAILFWAIGGILLPGNSFCAQEDYNQFSLEGRRVAINEILDQLSEHRGNAVSGDDAETEMPWNSTPATATVGMPEIVPNSAATASPKHNKKQNKKKYKIHGVARTGFGIDMDDNDSLIFTRANADLNERNYRLLSSDQLNRKQNTFDPAIYSRLKLIMDLAVTSAVSAHMNVTVDPWSIVGKSDVMHVTGSWGTDSINIQYLFWKNTGYTVNQIAYTQILGDSIALPEIKLRKGRVPATTVTSNFGDIFQIPSAKIHYRFQPIREAWVDVKPNDKVFMRIFPLGYQDQALTSDDPLRLSNNKIGWESSPWLNDWAPGIYNSFPPGDFTKGQWDKSLAFFTRDSDGTRLTALRGFTMNLDPDEDTSIKATIASPKTLWQDYADVTAVPVSIRAKHYLGDKAYIGTVNNAHFGYADQKKDAENYTSGLDAAVLPVEGVKINAQISRSNSRYDLTTPYYASKKEGDAYYASLQMATYADDLLKKDYGALLAGPTSENFFKTRLYWGRMDKDFESSLANYHETRRDAFWSRHLTFYPHPYFHMPGQTKGGYSEFDQAAFAIGNGLDYGRKVVGWRGDAEVFQERLKGFVDVRRVTTIENKPVETVAHTEWTFRPTDQLTTKVLGVWDARPKTTEGFDPFIVDGNTALPLANIAIEGGKDPSIKTGALGARYAINEWSAVNGVLEYSNDATVGTDNFPRGNLNSASFITYQEDGLTYRRVYPFLYSQSFFEQAPYDFHNIFKAGLELIPDPIWHIYLDYTRNPNEFAGNIDDNMNHYGIESSLVPNSKWGLFGRYVYSQWNDLDRLVFDNEIDYKGYNNFFFEARYLPRPSTKLSLEYGVGPTYNVASSFTNPLLAYYASPTLETQHMIRVVYEKKF